MARNFLNFPPEEGQTDDFKRRFLQAYLAGISYADACAGRVLETLEKTGLDENTIVLFAGDHGYLMGEYGSWGHKHCNYELATRAPLIVAKPGMKAAGQGTNALVEFVDFYPTLAELAGLPIPAHVEGTSFAPLLENPELSWKKAAFSEMLRQQERLGRSIRTERYRYVEWRGPKGALLAKELYDHRSDPEETENLAERAEYAETIELLSRQLEAGWKSALP